MKLSGAPPSNRYKKTDFRAQIDSLKEENRILQQLSRDRDMEMADQRDRFEALVARADMLTRERDALQDQVPLPKINFTTIKMARKHKWKTISEN